MMSSAKLLAAACAALTILPVRGLVLGVRQNLADSPLGVAFPTALNPPRTGPLLPVSVTVVTLTTTASPSKTPSPSASGAPTRSFPGEPTLGSGTGTETQTETDNFGTPTDMPTFSVAVPTTTDTSLDANPPGTGESNVIGNNRTLVIVLSSVLSVVGLFLILGALFLWRFRRKRRPLFSRGISPIDDDEIATWKLPQSEKAGLSSAAVEGPGNADVGPLTGVVGGVATAAAAAVAGSVAGRRGSDGSPSHAKQMSTSSIKKPPSVIIYSNAHGQGNYRRSSDDGSPRSFVHDSGRKMSLDKMLPHTPIQARAPNARAGLTDESIPGDMPFIPDPKRLPARLSKMPPGLTSGQRRNHVRTRSSRSSIRSFGDYGYGVSDLDVSTRHSHDYIPRSSHWRVYSSSSIPPRVSLDNEGWHSPRPLLGDGEIGRAIG